MTNYNFSLTDDNKIRITFPYDPDAVSAVKSFSTRNWNGDLKCWEIPLILCPEIPKILGVQAPKQIFDKYEHIYKIKTIIFDPKLLRPEIKPYNFQISGVEFISTYKNVLLADEVGLGKTLQAIISSLHLNCKKILVVCPSSVKKQWSREIVKFTDKTCTIIEGSQKQREKQYLQDTTFYIVNYELILKDINYINQRVWDMVIADEVSRIKNWKSKTKTAILRIKTNFKIGISATPIENCIQELHSILSWINPDILGSYWNFINEYCYFCNNSYGGYKITGIKDGKKLHETLKQVMIRRKKSDVYAELPDIIHNEYYIPLSSTQEKMYNEIKHNIMNLVQKDEMDNNVLNEIMYLRELCNSPRLLNPELAENGKVTEIIEIIQPISIDHKILIFSQWTKFLDLLGEELTKNNIEYVSLRGDIPQDTREKNILKFNTDPNTKIFLMSDAGNTGLNLQVADVLIHCDLLWNPAKMTQREGRIHRIGQRTKVNVITIMTEGTIEEKVYNLLKTKSDLFNKIIEDEQNIIFNKEIIRKIFKDK